MVDENRRNYYRILRVQPDASAAVIRNNYRTLLQKLRLHPDLGGDHWNASLLNEAYNTLRHPQRRAEYDQELLQQYHIHELSQGHLGRGNEKPVLKSVINDPGNQRNYYRILHIQSDSPTAIVHSSYRTLVKRNGNEFPLRLLKEAHETLGNPLKRALYDRLLRQYSHADAIAILKRTFSKQADEKPVNNTIAPGNSIKPDKPRDEKPAATNVRPLFHTYAPAITRYCTFCKTPHNHGNDFLNDALCPECQSPLAPPSSAFTGAPRRQINRITLGGQVDCWLDWPDRRRTATLVDLSPTGIRLALDIEPDQNQLIKIDAIGFRAVGEVSYCQPQNRQYIAGLSFRTIQFSRQKGQFLQTHV